VYSCKCKFTSVAHMLYDIEKTGLFKHSPVILPNPVSARVFQMMQKLVLAAVLLSAAAAAAVAEEAEPEIHPAVISLASAEGATATDAKSQRVKTLAAAKQLMKLMNVAAMAEERAKELIEEARKADAEADLVRAPIQDQSDKKARYHRAKTLQNAQTLNIEAAQALVKARKLAGMVRELKESAKAKTA